MAATLYKTLYWWLYEAIERHKQKSLPSVKQQVFYMP